MLNGNSSGIDIGMFPLFVWLFDDSNLLLSVARLQHIIIKQKVFQILSVHIIVAAWIVGRKSFAIAGKHFFVDGYHSNRCQR